MGNGSYVNSGDFDHQVCDVYSRTDFMVTTGLNSGEGIDSAAESNPGDVYVFSAKAKAYDMIVPENDTDHFGADSNGQSEGSGLEIGTLGEGLDLESRLTFCGSDASTVEVLILKDTTSDRDCGSADHSDDYFLPLSPLDPNVEYTLVSADSDPGSFSYADYKCVCFARGTLIRLADGTEKLVQDLDLGDLVMTQDNGAQPVRWVGGRAARAFGHLAPIVISKDALGNHSDLVVSQQHRMLLSDWRAEVMLGSHEVLVKAKDLINGDTIYRRDGGVVEYFHILFDTHEIIYAEGIPSESLHMNQSTLDSMAEDSRAEIIELFPELKTNPQISAVASRMSLKSYEATALLKQVGFR